MKSFVFLGVLCSILMPLSADQVEVEYLGHSCFSLQANAGPVIIIDPYGTFVPYPALPRAADVVLMTHGHIDHCPYCFE